MTQEQQTPQWICRECGGSTDIIWRHVCAGDATPPATPQNDNMLSMRTHGLCSQSPATPLPEADDVRLNESDVWTLIDLCIEARDQAKLLAATHTNTDAKNIYLAAASLYTALIEKIKKGYLNETRI